MKDDISETSPERGFNFADPSPLHLILMGGHGKNNRQVLSPIQGDKPIQGFQTYEPYEHTSNS